jgi:hypothetical protein
MGNHNLHKIGLTFLGEEEEEAIRLRDPEPTGGKQQILPRPGSKWEKDERKWAESKPGGRFPIFRKQQLLQSCRKDKNDQLAISSEAVVDDVREISQ